MNSGKPVGDGEMNSRSARDCSESSLSARRSIRLPQSLLMAPLSSLNSMVLMSKEDVPQSIIGHRSDAARVISAHYFLRGLHSRRRY